MNKTSPLLLLILDGWGCDEPNENNAISLANTPQWDCWQQNICTSTLKASGTHMGLPSKQMGNSEVGHMHIGAGRTIKQNLTKISDDIQSGDFFKNATLCQHIIKAKKNNKAIHIMGLVSEGGVHSHQNHLNALIDMLTKHDIDNAYVHAFLDGRDTPPNSGKKSITCLIKKLDKTPFKLASLCGRFYAMDRDNRWQRTQRAYQLLTNPDQGQANDPIDVITRSYQNNVYDEFIEPTPLIDHQAINEGDLVIYFNFRADRARQLSHALSDLNFNEFKRERSVPLSFLTMTQYDSSLNAQCIYLPSIPQNTLGECVANANMHQLRIAETEKYAHVTFFLNGGLEESFPLEKRILIKSPNVKTYDLKPEMSCHELTEALTNAIDSKEYQLIVCNFANADMVGHTGDLNAAVKAIEALDKCFIKIDHSIKKSNTNLIVTADHGNAEKMFDETTKLAHTAHTNHPVPFIYIGSNPMNISNHDGCLTDIAPTILKLLNIEPPKEMTGDSLLKPIKSISQ